MVRVAVAQENTTTVEISAGANLSAVSQLDGVLIVPRWSPAVALVYRSDIFLIDSENGIGVALFRDRPVHIGALLDYQYGRRVAAESRYRGLGNIDGALAPAVFIEWEPIRDALDFYAKASKATAGSMGWLYKLEFSGGLPLAQNKSIYVDITANASDGAYAQSYYGVSAEQSAASGYAPYSPRGGWLTLNSAVGYEYRYSQKLALDAQIGQLRYLDSAAQSPLTSGGPYLTAGVFASYRY
ncbi:MAG: MipA/OmpV family protein [Verrucomicrobiaceae bacterium]|nr:MipA/OmpV family protein [Verrucomicrobiaceae bacterium]